MPREELPKKDDAGQVIDYLDEDPEIPTQRYAIISFISPEKVIKQRTEFFNEEFLKWQDYEWKIRGMEQYNAFLAKKYNLKVEALFKDLQEFTKVHNEEIKKTDIHEQYQVFLLKEEKNLDARFTEKVDFQTNVRGVKVRRVFSELAECQQFAKVLQRRYPRDNLFIGKVGTWLVWDPSEHVMPEVEYAVQELNELMRKYKENETNREIFFEEEKNEKIKQQRLENEKRKAKALEDAKKDGGLADTSDLKSALETAVHPAEGAIRE
jgi:Family of unknown function (DUF5832)